MVTSETWKRLDGFDCEVSSLGGLRDLAGTPIRQTRHSHGYLQARVQIGQARRKCFVHRLICEAFHGPPPTGWECDHLNYRRDDNRADNLRWVSPEENKAHRRIACGEMHGSAKLAAADVQRIRRLFPTVSNTAIGVRFGVHRRTIADIRNGVTWK